PRRQVVPRPHLAVLAQHLDGGPPFLIKVNVLPARCGALRRFPGSIADQNLFALLGWRVAEPDDQSSGPTVVASLDRDDVLAGPEILADVKAVELFPAIPAASGDAVDPDSEGIVSRDVELGLGGDFWAGPVDGKAAAEVARCSRCLAERIALVEPDPLHAAQLRLGLDRVVVRVP